MMYRVHLVCEGPTENVVIGTSLDHYLDDFELIRIQPERSLFGGDQGPLGGGWKGVRGKPTRLVRRKQGRIRKDPSAYRRQQDRLTRAWPGIMTCCREARRFDADLTARLWKDAAP